jgi:hypothetical protein
LSFIDNAHPPAAQLLYHAIMRDRLPDHWRESYVPEKGQVNEAWGLTEGAGKSATPFPDNRGAQVSCTGERRRKCSKSRRAIIS